MEKSKLAKLTLNNFSESEFLTIADLSGIIDDCPDILDSLWNSNPETGSSFYPQKRMSHLLDCISRVICRSIMQQLSVLDLWSIGRGSDTRKLQMLQTSINLLGRWCQLTTSLTNKWYRPRDELHAWIGRTYEDNFSLSFKQRLVEVSNILTSAEELSQILPREEQHNFQMEKLFLPLKDINPILYNPYTESLWTKAVKDYERLIDPVESAVVNKFKKKIDPFMDKPMLLLGEFQKYKNLMSKPTIRRAIVPQRESLLKQLRIEVKKMEDSVDRDDFGEYNSDDEGRRSKGVSNKSNGSKLLSPLVGSILYLRQIGSKVSSLYSTSKELLMDLDDYQKFASQCESLISRVKGEEDSKFENWLADLKRKFDDGDDSLRLHGSLMGWRDGVLVVNFSDDLVRFLREFRQLDELGLELPKPSSGARGKTTLADRAIEAEKYYRYGILLKKTANLYNSLSEQMIDVQEQLLLGSLNSFASLVSKPSQNKKEQDLSWSNPAECESYIKTLQEAAEKLSSENRWLRNIHESLKVQTIALMETDLQRQGESWKSKWRAIKEKMITVKSRYNEKDSNQWVLHWDHQIYKALEASYQKGLETVNDNLPEIKVELIFSNKTLEFKPPSEQIRQNYYKELKKFVNIPYSFEGFGSNAQIYKKMGSRNSKRLVQVYFKAEILFDKLNDMLVRYNEWIQLGQIDLDQYIEANVKTSDEYSVNFKMLKSKRKDIDRLPDQEKVYCCTVSLLPLKGSLDELLTRIGDALLVNLRRSLIDEFKEVDQYLEAADEKLNSRPKTVDEIGTAKKQWKEIDSKKHHMMTVSKNCVDKKKLLSQYAPGTAVDISDISKKMADLDGEGGRWDKFEIALEAYDNLIEDQKEVLKGTLEEEEVNLNIEIDKFSNRWRQLKPSDVKTKSSDGKNWDQKDAQKVFDSLEEWKTQFSELEAKTTKLTEARQTFNMPNPRFEGLETLQEDIKQTSKSWDMLKEYLEELGKMSEEDWINFTNIYVLQDFASKWAENMRAAFTRSSYDSVAEYIVTNVERIKRSIPALKYCKSEAFKEDHWTELLQGKLQLPRDLRADKLKVEHFLSKLDILMEPATLTYVKNLQARALGK